MLYRLLPLAALVALASCKDDKKSAPAPSSHTITFDIQIQGVTPPPPATVERGKLATPPADPTRPAGSNGEQYSFEDWYSSPSGNDKFDFANTPITGNRTLYARWTATQQPPTTPQPGPYRVAFDSQGGSDVPATTVERGKLATPPANPTRPAGSNGEQYSFQGWYDNSRGGAKFDFAAKPITGPITLYAQWAVTQQPTTPQPGVGYTVAFEVNGGSAIASVTVQPGQRVARPADPKRKDANTIFDRPLENWYADAALTRQFSFSEAINDNTTLYAKYDETIYLVSTAEQLKAVGEENNLRASYRLIADIDLKNALWTPIGENENKAFLGHFNGQGHVIRNLRVDRSDQAAEDAKAAAGLFGVVSKNITPGMVVAVGLENVDVKGRIDGAGALVGSLFGVASGYVIGGSIEGSSGVGGLVGVSYGGVVTGYAQQVKVKGFLDVGGLVGFSGTNGPFFGQGATTVGYAQQVEVTGDTRATQGGEAGGLVGKNGNASTVTGYMRGSVQRNPAEKYVSFGLLVGDAGGGVIKGYHSGKESESRLVGITTAQRTGEDGTPITVTSVTMQNAFSNFVFSDKPGEWAFTPGRWPAINLEGIPVARQDANTMP